MRRGGVPRLLFSSTGSVYGEMRGRSRRPRTLRSRCRRRSTARRRPRPRATSPPTPKPACSRRRVFRFVSVLGPRYSHGHVIDFVRQLSRRPRRLRDARRRHAAQELHARARLRRRGASAASTRTPQFEVFNLGVDDYCTVTDVGRVDLRAARRRTRVRVHRRGPRLDRRQSVHLPRNRPDPAAGWAAAFTASGRPSRAPSTTSSPTPGCSTPRVTVRKPIRYRDGDRASEPSMTSFSRTFLDDTHQDRSTDSTTPTSRRRSSRCGTHARTRRPPVLLRLRRRRRPRVARGLRLPQARPHRVLLRDRQRRPS